MKCRRPNSEAPDDVRRLPDAPPNPVYCFLPAGGFFLPLGTRQSDQVEHLVVLDLVTSRRTPFGLGFVEVWPRVLSEAAGYDWPAGELGRIPIAGTGLVAADRVQRFRGPDDDLSLPWGALGESLRSRLPESGLVALAAVRPRALWFDDELPADEGWAGRLKLAGPPGVVAGPQVRRVASEAPEASELFLDLVVGQRTRLLGLGDAVVGTPGFWRVRVSVAEEQDPSDYDGTTKRPPWSTLSNDGQVVLGPYYVEALHLFQAGAQAGVLLTEG